MCKNGCESKNLKQSDDVELKQKIISFMVDDQIEITYVKESSSVVKIKTD